jgi:hypothetical protein
MALLHHCVENDRTDIALLLIEAGADIHALDKVCLE